MSEGLDQREGLPDALRILLEKYPRDTWRTHQNFAGLVEFWMDRHIGFRRLLKMMQTHAQERMDGKSDNEIYRNRLYQLGSRFVGDLHMHHNIEDHHYFPRLTELEQRLARGFDLLDKDHQMLDTKLQAFTARANGVLHEEAEVGPLLEELEGFEKFLDRHLLDEEDLIVPVILKHGPNRLE